MFHFACGSVLRQWRRVQREADEGASTNHGESGKRAWPDFVTAPHTAFAFAQLLYILFFQLFPCSR
jgi:hypothetical protein